MKKKKSTDREGVIWPASHAKKEEKPTNHHHQPKPPGSDDHHAQEAAREEDNMRVWREKNQHDLPPKPRKKG